MAEQVTVRRRIRRIDGATTRPTVDLLAAEEPLEIRVGGEAVSVTMRTPGSDFELAAGFCLTEGVIADPADIAHIRYCAGTDPDTGLQTYNFAEPGSTKHAEDRLRRTYNIVDIARRDGGTVPVDLRRNVYTTSSCGICGTASIDAVRRDYDDIDDDVVIDRRVLATLPDAMRAAQRMFDRTGGLHAAARFDADGALLDLREDVGRHNAVDKLIGAAALAGELPLTGQVLMVSGRVAFEIVQKALRARIPVIAAVSAPTSLAVELAASANVTLAGFVRGDRMNVYTGQQRIM
ncbi:MAG: formate dehydrogenase accessory sulfurtransferase FdhD [Actinobacteria bacterium]|nr:formate dehydrogenase accessory sulfurtransferase FdhD [Actinomycetota bacterium]